MLTKRDTKILQKLNITETENDLASRLINYEKKYKINSLDLFLKEECYLPQFKKNEDFVTWTNLIKIFLKEKHDLNLINTIKKIPKVCVLGDKNEKIEKAFKTIKEKIILVPDTYENLEKILYLAEINRNFVYVFTDDSELAKEYNKKFTAQTVLTRKKYKKAIMLEESDYYLILNDDLKESVDFQKLLHEQYNLKNIEEEKKED